MRSPVRPAALIQAHLDTLDPGQRELVEALQRLVLANAPGLAQTLQWGNIVFQRHGRNAIGIAAHRDHVHLQFFNGQALAVQFSALEGHGRGLRFLKLRASHAIDEALVANLVRASIEEME